MNGKCQCPNKYSNKITIRIPKNYTNVKKVIGKITARTALIGTEHVRV